MPNEGGKSSNRFAKLSKIFKEEESNSLPKEKSRQYNLDIYFSPSLSMEAMRQGINFDVCCEKVFTSLVRPLFHFPLYPHVHLQGTNQMVIWRRQVRTVRRAFQNVPFKRVREFLRGIGLVKSGIVVRQGDFVGMPPPLSAFF